MRNHDLTVLERMFQRWDAIKREFVESHENQKSNARIIEEALHGKDYGDETRPE